MIELKNLAFPKIAGASYSDPVRKFMGSLIIDKGTIQNNKKLFYDSYDLQVTDIFRVLDEEQFEKYKPRAMKEFKFEIQSGVVREFFDNKPFTLKVPVVSINDNTDITTNVIKFFLKPLAQQGKIDDLLYNVYRQIFLMLRIYANYKTGEIGFGDHKGKDGIIYGGKGVGGADKFEFKELTLEEVLEKEIEQGFVSESIGDPSRGYGYTHLLREHAKFRLTNWGKNVLMNRSRYNIIATSRGQGKCQHKDSRIMLSNGSFKKAIDIRVGDSIMGSLYQEEKVTGVEYFKKKTVKILLDNGMEKIVSYDHRMPTAENFNNGAWDVDENLYKRAYQLKKGDKVPVAFGYKTNREDFTGEDLMLYGYFLGDGTRGNNYIHGNHERLLDIVKDYTVTHQDQDGCKKYCISGYKQKTSFKGIDELSYNKYIDDRIFSQSRDLKFKFLEGLFNTDSYLGVNKRGVVLEYSTTSKKLAEGLIELLYSLGIMATIRSKNFKSNFKKTNDLAYFVLIRTRGDLKYILKNIDLSSKYNYKKFLDNVYNDVIINNNIGTIPLRAFKERTTKGVTINKQVYYDGIRGARYDFQKWKLEKYGIKYWDKYSRHKVVDVIEMGEDDVVSIEISGDDKLYFSNGIMSHNTFLAGYIAVRGLLDPRPGFGGRSYREIKVFVPNFEVVGAQMMKYIKMFIGDLADKKLPNKQKLFNIGAKEITCNLTGNVLQIISLFKVGQERELGLGVGEGVAADLAIIDEGARIPDSFWQSFHQRAAFETQEFFLISTINKETPADHWFYKLLLEGEAEEEGIKSYRVDIDNNEVMRWGKTEEQWRSEVEAAKETLREGGDIELYAKGYCIILDQSNVFNTAYATIGTDMQKYSDNDFRILGFDLAKLDDDAGLTIINLTHMEVESSIRKKNLTYGTQLENVQELKKQYPNLLVIGDRSGVGEAVAEQDIGGVVDVWIKSTGAGELKYNKQRGYYTCNKGFIINNLATLLSTNVLKIPQWNFDLITQMNNFVKIQSSRSETLLYKGKGKEKDDLVLSLAYASLYMSVILGIKNKDDAEKYVNEIGNNSIYSYNTTEEYQGGGYNYYNSLY